MGLLQEYKFSYESGDKLKAFLFWLFTEYETADGILVIKGENFQLLGSIEPFGLRCDLSGEYHKPLGYLVEHITGQYGSVQIDDV